MWLPATHGRIIELIALKYPSIHPSIHPSLQLRKHVEDNIMHAKKNTKKTDCTLLGGALVEDLNNVRERDLQLQLQLQAYTVSKIYVCLAKITSIGASGGPNCDLRVG